MPARRTLSATIRRQVAAWAHHRCTYCRSPAEVGVPMVIDHIIPLAAGGTNDLTNLCLACYRCNEFKGPRSHAPDPHDDHEVPLFHPRQQHWHDHFAWHPDGLTLVGRTPTGRATIVALKLNSDWLIQARRLWIRIGLHPPVE